MMYELTANEIGAVFGGDGTSTSLPPGTCPPGYVVQSVTYDSNGNMTSITCVPSSNLNQANEIASTGESIISIINAAGEWISSWF